MWKYIFILLLICTIPFYCFAQILKGQIVDNYTKKPIAFASISLPNNHHGSICDQNGFFKLETGQKDSILLISSMGYRNESINIKKGIDSILISLTPVNYEMGEILVYASKNNSKEIKLKSKQVRKFAGATNDVFRSVMLLPGVSSNNVGSARYNVRGGTYDENLVLIDGIQTNEPFHMKYEPLAQIGIFNIDMVESINFSVDGFNAKYNDLLSSVLDVKYKDGNLNKFKTKINASLIDASIVCDGPVSKNSSVIFGYRKSFLSYLLKKTDANTDAKISYSDFNARYTYFFSPKHKISLTAIYANDKCIIGPSVSQFEYTANSNIRKDVLLLINGENTNTTDYSARNYLFSLQSSNRLSKSIKLNSQFSFYNENEIVFDESKTFQDAVSTDSLYYYNYEKFQQKQGKLKVLTYEAKSTLSVFWNANNSLNIGLYTKLPTFKYIFNYKKRLDYELNISNYPDTTNINNNSDMDINTIVDSYYYGGFISHQWQYQGRLFTDIGVRFDYTDFNKELEFLPRLNLSYKPFTDFSINASWGITSKRPNYKQVKDTIASKNNTQNQSAIHNAIGVTKKINDFSIKAQAFYKVYNDMIPVERNGNGTLNYSVKENNSEGYAKGIDLQIELTRHFYNLWLSYELLESKETIEGSEVYYPRFTDQRHTLSSLINFILPKNWEIDIKCFYGSGYAYNEMIVHI